MKKLITSILAIACLLSTTANAALYDFSYTLSGNYVGNGVVTGSLTGDLVGDYVQNIGNIQVSFNGTPLSGPLFMATYTPSYGWIGMNNTSVSTIASLNNFIISDSDVANGSWNFTNQFWMVNGTGWSQVLYRSLSNGIVASDYPIATSNWSLTAANLATPVPEPETYAMLLVGLGLLGFMACRRKCITA